VVGLIAMDRLGVFGASQNDWQAFDRRAFAVDRVTAGDRIVIRTGDGLATIRLLGVAAPDAGRPGSAESAAYTQARLAGQSVTLRLEPTQTRDADGVLLAYAYLSDNDNVNLDLIRDGKAYADRRAKHTFASGFEQTENEARKKNRGLWNGLRVEDQPAWRQAWLKAFLAERQAATKPSL